MTTALMNRNENLEEGLTEMQAQAVQQWKALFQFLETKLQSQTHTEMSECCQTQTNSADKVNENDKSVEPKEVQCTILIEGDELQNDAVDQPTREMDTQIKQPKTEKALGEQQFYEYFKMQNADFQRLQQMLNQQQRASKEAKMEFEKENQRLKALLKQQKNEHQEFKKQIEEQIQQLVDSQMIQKDQEIRQLKHLLKENQIVSEEARMQIKSKEVMLSDKKEMRRLKALLSAQLEALCICMSVFEPPSGEEEMDKKERTESTDCIESNC